MRKVSLGATLMIVASLAQAGNWPQWRGPFYNGSAEETNLPLTWSQTENVAWATALPGPGEATPIVWGDRVFVSSADANNKSLHALCLSVKDGRILWQRKVAEATRSAPNNTMACPSPVTDGKRVCFLYGTGDLAAFDVNGRVLWTRDLAKDFGQLSVKFGYSSSPLLFDVKLYVQVLRRKTPYEWSGEGQWPTDSFLLAINAGTGRDLWKHQRETDAVEESQDAYTTPVLYRGPPRTEIIVAGGDYVTGHHPKTGEETWRLGYDPRKQTWWRLVASPVPGEGLIYAVCPRGGNPMFAIPAGKTGRIAWDDLAWVYDRSTPDVSVPLLYRGRLYVVDDNRRRLSCLDPATGRQLWQGELSREDVIRASPTGADGRIYLISEAGNVTVLATGDEFKVLSRIPMGSNRVRSSIAAAQGRLFIRTSEKLYCIGGK